MRFYCKPTLFFAVLSLSALSCSLEEMSTSIEEFVEEAPVVVMFGAGTRGAVPEDCCIENFRVLIYKSNSGELAWNFPITADLPSENFSTTLHIATGIYDFVFVANGTGVYSGATPIDLSDDAQVNHFSKLNNLTFDRNAFGFHAAIPMVRVFKRVDVANDNKIKTIEMNDYQTGVWMVEMERVAIKLDFCITLSEWQYVEWDQKIVIKNIPGRAYLFAEKDNSSLPKAYDMELEVSSGFLSVTPDSDGNMLITCAKQILLPELYLTPTNNVAPKAMLLEMEFGGVTKSAHISCEADNYAIPRNTWLTLNATVKEEEIDLVAQLLPWGDAGLDDIDFDGQYRFRADQSELTFAHFGGSQTIELFTDYPDGWKVESVTSGGWIVSPTTVAFGVSNSFTPLVVTCLQNFYPEARTGSVVVRAGNLLKTIKVTQQAGI